MKLLGHHIPILYQVLTAIVLGILCGFFTPDWIVRIFVTFNDIFGQFINFCVPLIILFLVSASIADTKSNAKRMLIVTLVLAYVSTVVAGLFSYSVSSAILPHCVDFDPNVTAADNGSKFSTYFHINLPPTLDVISSLVLAFIIGLGIVRNKAIRLGEVINDLRNIIVFTIRKTIVPLLPLFIFGIFLQMTANGAIGSVLHTFLYVIIVVFGLHIVWLVTLYLIAGLISHRNPFKMMWTMLPAYLTALGTSSSAATIPITLYRAKTMGVKLNVVEFVVPLCANIHLSGSCLKIVSCAMALMIMVGHPFTLPMFVGFICLIGITLIAAPGVPGGAIMAALPILASMLGFDANMQAIMISLYITMDSFGTACNVMGDGALTAIVERIIHGKRVSKATR